MPRKRRAARAFRAPGPGRLSREQALQALAGDPFGVLSLGAEHGAVQAFTEREREGILAQHQRRVSAERAASRLSVLRARIVERPVETWGGIFSEAPEIEWELSSQQRKTWHGWLRSRGVNPEDRNERNL